jgi:hypothetical protein
MEEEYGEGRTDDPVSVGCTIRTGAGGRTL